MNLRTSLLASTCALLPLPLLCGAQQTAVNQEPPPESKTASPSLKVETASVEEVLATDDDGFRASTYVVRWYANRVLLVDPLASTPLAVGDDAHFLVTHLAVAKGYRVEFRRKAELMKAYGNPTAQGAIWGSGIACIASLRRNRPDGAANSRRPAAPNMGTNSSFAQSLSSDTKTAASP
jgi:hypothetical protein